MPKRVNDIFIPAITFRKLLEAHNKTKKGKRFKKQVIEFEMDMESNIIQIEKELLNGTYKFSKYFEFKIYEPKERIIKTLKYRDRVVHQWYVEEFIKPYIVPKFINSSFACIIDRGTHKANNYIQHQMQIFKRNYGDFWVLKCDIRRFFYNIDPNILYHILCKYIGDPYLKRFTKQLIFDGRDIIGDVGIPIGNYTSQYFANIYLNELDQYVKRILKVKFYRQIYG